MTSIFNIQGKSSDYGWGLRDDGVEGIVVWKGSWWTHLSKGTEICFTDKTVNTDYLFSGGSLNGGVYTIKGNSADYGWGLRDDGVEGIVIWKGSWWAHLPKGTDIKFNDKTVDTDYLFSGGTLNGHIYTVNANSGEYGWGLRDDGVEGIVIWKGAWWAHLPKGTDIKFNDKYVDTEYLFPNGNKEPVAGDDNFAGLAGTPVKGNVLLNDSDPDGDPIIAVLQNGPSNGSLVLNSDGSFTYTPNSGFTGTDTFTYFAQDPSNGCDVGKVTITVPPGGGKTASIGDRVWLDANRNGLQDNGEAGVAGINVELKDANGNVIASQTTDANGNYLFDKLAAGNYAVGVSLKQGYAFTTQDANGNGADADDSDVSPFTSTTGTIALKDGEAIRTVDAGLVLTNVEPPKTASIGDRVWLDANKNGVQDDNEAGVANVTVQLKDAGGNIVASQQTDSAGNYLFDKLAAGNYTVNVAQPNGYDFTSQDAFGNNADAIDSDVNASGSTGNIALQAGQAIRTVDAGLVVKGPVNTASLGDRVFEDANFNGIQDAGEKGIANVKVNLTDANGTVLKTMTTDADGNYKFTDLAAGDYKVKVEGPTGYFVTKSNIGDDAKDSDIGSNGITGVIRLNEGQTDLTVDAGLYRKGVIGDHLWADTPVGSGDGIQKDNGTGSEYAGYYIPFNVTVRLYKATGELVATTTSDKQGNYRFENVDPGDYYVDFDNSTANGYFTGSGLNWQGYAGVAGFVWTKKDQGTDDTQDSDVTPYGPSIGFETLSGYRYGNYMAKTDVFSLASGQIDLTRDAGLQVSPIALDLNGDGKIGVTGETSSKDKSGITEVGKTVQFDLDADGKLDTIEWIDGKGDGLLIDVTKIGANGEIDGNALFGDMGGKFGNGYEKLALHDANGDGKLNGAELKDLSVWIDNGDAILQEGELRSLADTGVAELSTGMNLVADTDGRMLMQSTATMADGSTMMTEDVWFSQVGSSADESAPAFEAPVVTEMPQEYHPHH